MDFYTINFIEPNELIILFGNLINQSKDIKNINKNFLVKLEFLAIYLYYYIYDFIKINDKNFSKFIENINELNKVINDSTHLWKFITDLYNSIIIIHDQIKQIDMIKLLTNNDLMKYDSLIYFGIFYDAFNTKEEELRKEIVNISKINFNFGDLKSSSKEKDLIELNKIQLIYNINDQMKLTQNEKLINIEV